MAITPPSLDDRRFDDLVDDLIARIPAHTPEWTNPRLGDPGRTLIELFAWLGDALLYRANLIPERQRLVFLRLLGQPLRRRAAGARHRAACRTRSRPRRGVQTLRPGAVLAGPVPFETLAETTVLPVTAEAYIKRALEPRRSAHASARWCRRWRASTASTARRRPTRRSAVFAGDRADAGRRRRVRRQRRPRAVAGAARAAGRRGPTDQPAANIEVQRRARRRRRSRAGAALDRHRAGARGIRAVRRHRAAPPPCRCCGRR